MNLINFKLMKNKLFLQAIWENFHIFHAYKYIENLLYSKKLIWFTKKERRKILFFDF